MFVITAISVRKSRHSKFIVDRAMIDRSERERGLIYAEPRMEFALLRISRIVVDLGYIYSRLICK